VQLITPFLLKKKSNTIRIVAWMLCLVVLIGVLATTAFAQNTYVITDGDQVTVHTTYATDPAKILNEAGVELNADDFYTTQVTDGVSEINVQRAQVITINNCGQQVQVNSYGQTVESLLDSLTIPTEGNYSVSVPLDTVTYDGLQINVDCTVSAEQTYTVELPYKTTYCYDPTMPEGSETVITEGKAGQALRTDNVVCVNSQEQKRSVVRETVLKQPVDQVVAVGTGTDLGGDKDRPLIGDGIIVLPTGEVLTYTSTDQFLATAYTKTDDGCDETTATGTPVHWGVVAVDPTVIPYGTRMFIVTNDGFYVYGLSTAEDCGGDIIGHRLDLYMETDPECWQFGVRDCTVYFLGDANWR